MINKTLIFVSKKSQLAQALKLCDKLLLYGKTPFILTKYNFPVASQRYPVKHFRFYEKFFNVNFRNIKENAYDLFRFLSGEKISNDLTLRELTKYKGISLWDFSVEHISLKFQAILYEFNMLEAVLNFERPSTVIIISKHSDIEKLFALICEGKQIPFLIHNKTNSRKQNLNRIFKRLIFFTKRTKRFIRSLFYFGSNLIKIRGMRNKCKVIFFTSVKRYLNSIFPIIYKYKTNNGLIINSFPCSSKEIKKLGMPYMEFEGYKLYSVFDKCACRLLKKIYNSVNNSDFLNKAVYKGVPIGYVLRDIFKDLVFEVFYHNIQKIDIIRKILERHKPEVIVVIHYAVDISPAKG